MVPVNNPLSDAISIIRKDWKLLAGLNALYFCILVIGAALALISPGLHMSMIQFIGAETIGGQLNPPHAGIVESLETAGGYMVSSFGLNTLGMITIPSIILPLWAPVIGSARFFIWGVTYVSPLEGVLTMQNLLPQYVAMLIEGEAYIIAIFACIRQLITAIDNMGAGMKWMLREYAYAVLENLKLIIVVFILLAIASLYQAFVIPALAGLF